MNRGNGVLLYAIHAEWDDGLCCKLSRPCPLSENISPDLVYECIPTTGDEPLLKGQEKTPEKVRARESEEKGKEKKS